MANGNGVAVSILLFVLLGGAPVAAAAEGPPGPAPALTAAPPPTRERSGLAVSLGAGHGVGFLGAQLRYDLAVKPYLALSPFFGGGMGNVAPFAWSAGVAGGLGRRHRLAAEVAIAYRLHEELVLHGRVAAARDLYGLLAAIGYEHMSDGGWFQRVTVGVGPPPFSARVWTDAWIGTFSFLVGWKIW